MMEQESGNRPGDTMSARLSFHRGAHQRDERPASFLVWLARAAGVVGILWFLSFLGFVYSLPEYPPDPLPHADGIVALTGGEERIVAAMALLGANKGGRLLISGVHPDVTRDDLKKRIVDPGNLFACCVDLDRAARNTAGNAIETARWVRKMGYRSVIVVTAQYHMPRSLIELKRELPDVALIPYPVFPDKVHAKDWWREPGTARFLAFEHIKYLVARLRIGIAAKLMGPNAPAPA
jgi:uncharacterized SAM-binding protein YcdF (DUF218 family)